MFETGDELQFRKFATISEMQGRGFGSALLNHVFASANEKGLNESGAMPAQKLFVFYERFGMLPFGETWEQHGRLFVKMQIEL